MTPTDDLAAVVRDEAERCGVDVRELARGLLGWTAEEMQDAGWWVALRCQLADRVSVHSPALAASPPAAPGGDESGQ